MGLRSFNRYFENTVLEAMAPRTITSKSLLLIELQQIKKNGYSFENNEMFDGVSALSVPIILPESGDLYGTLSLTGMAGNVSRHRTDIVNALKEVASLIQAAINI